MLDVKVFNILTIARKIGKITLGFDATKDAVNFGTAKAVIISKNASEKTQKEMKFFTERENIPMYEGDFTDTDVLLKFGKKSKIIGVTDSGFAEGIKKFEK